MAQSTVIVFPFDPLAASQMRALFYSGNTKDFDNHIYLFSKSNPTEALVKKLETLHNHLDDLKNHQTQVNELLDEFIDETLYSFKDIHNLYDYLSELWKANEESYIDHITLLLSNIGDEGDLEIEFSQIQNVWKNLPKSQPKKSKKYQELLYQLSEFQHKICEEAKAASQGFKSEEDEFEHYYQNSMLLKCIAIIKSKLKKSRKPQRNLWITELNEHDRKFRILMKKQHTLTDLEINKLCMWIQDLFYNIK